MIRHDCNGSRRCLSHHTLNLAHKNFALALFTTPSPCNEGDVGVLIIIRSIRILAETHTVPIIDPTGTSLPFETTRRSPLPHRSSMVSAFPPSQNGPILHIRRLESNTPSPNRVRACSSGTSTLAFTNLRTPHLDFQRLASRIHPFRVRSSVALACMHRSLLRSLCCISLTNASRFTPALPRVHHSDPCTQRPISRASHPRLNCTLLPFLHRPSFMRSLLGWR